MSNADVFMILILILGYVFLACPALLATTNSSASYMELVLAGLVVTIFCALVVIILTSIWVSIAYFTGNVGNETPLADLIYWLNSL